MGAPAMYSSYAQYNPYLPNMAYRTIIINNPNGIYLKKDNMRFKNNGKEIFFSVWWIVEAYALYYYFMSFGIGIIIVTLLLILISCLLLLFQSYKIRAILYLLLSIFSIFSVLGMYILYLLSTRVELNVVWHYIFVLIIMA